jgi:NAD(P)-dependent dehydrogenase (short-subunit alcohol dehydrogenase family)
MELGLKGKRAIVTGGSSGIGRVCAVALAAEGVSVCAVGRDEGRLAAVAAELNARGEGFSVAADLSTADGCRRSVEVCAERFGGIDILINNAGNARQYPVLELPASLVEEALDLKLIGYLRMAQLVIPYMQRQGWGRIVNIAGAQGTSPSVNSLPASLANIGVLNLTRALTDAVASDSILINAICPGTVNNARTRRHRVEAAEREGREPGDLDAQIVAAGKALPAGRICEEDEIATVACFFASEACRFVFASAIYMDGGARRSTP